MNRRHTFSHPSRHATDRRRRSRRREYSVRIVDDVKEIDPAEWDAVSGPEDLQASHRFVRVCQQSGVENAVYRHILISRNGRVECCASLSMMFVRLELLAGEGVRSAVRQARALSPRFFVARLLFCGLPVSFGQSCLRFRTGADRHALLQILAGLMEEIGTELDAQVLCWKEFSDETVVMDELCARGYLRAPSLPFFRLDVCRPSFGAYVSRMRSGYRRQVAQTMKVRRSSGLTVRAIADYGDEVERIFGLYEEVMDRADHQLERLNVDFFRQLSEAFEEDSSAILIEREGRLLACAVLLHAGRTTTFLLAGLDYDDHKQYQSYQNLLLEVISIAIRKGSRRIELGQTSAEAKSRLGAIAQERVFYLRATNGFVQALLRLGRRWLFPPADIMERRVFRSGDPDT